MNRLFRMIFVAVVLSFCLVGWVCAASPELTVGSVTETGESEFVDLPVSITGNPGITQFEVMVDAGRVLVMDSVVSGEQAGAMCRPQDFESTTARVTWSSSEPLEGDGTLFFLRFQRPKPGDYEVKLTLRNMKDGQGNSIKEFVSVISGVLSVKEAANFEVLFYEDASRDKLLNEGNPQPADSLSEAFLAIAGSSGKVGTVLVKADTSSKESAVVQEGSDVEVDFAGHSFTAEGACAISNAGTLALNDSADRPGLVSSAGQSAVYNTGRLEILGGAYQGVYAVVNEGGTVRISGGLFSGDGEPFSGDCPLKEKTRLALVEDEKDRFYQFWEVVPAPDCTVRFFEEDGVTLWESVTVSYGQALTPPQASVKPGDSQFDYEFEGWYTERVGGEKADFSCVESSFDVYARYTAKEHVHQYREDVIAPTCVKKGYTLFTCGCGDRYRGDETSLVAHQWEATASEEVFSCKVCGALRSEVRREIRQVQMQGAEVVEQALCGQQVQFGKASVTLYAQALEALAQGDVTLRLEGDVGELVLDAGALKTLWEASGGQSVCLVWERCEPLRGELSGEADFRIAEMEEYGGVTYRWAVLRGDQEEILQEGFAQGEISLHVPFEAEPGQLPFALAVDEKGNAAEHKTSVTQEGCAIALQRPGRIGLMAREEGAQLILTEKTRHVDAGGQALVDVALQASAGQRLEGVHLRVCYDKDALTFSGAQGLLQGLTATLPAGEEGVVEISGELPDGLEITQTENLLATLAFSVHTQIQSKTVCLDVEQMPKITLAGQEQVVPVGRSAEISLWNLTVQLLPKEHVQMQPVTAYVKYGQAGLYEDAARQTLMQQPVLTADDGYMLEEDCWYEESAQQAMDFSSLQQMAFLENATIFVRAKPVVYSITYHLGEGENHPGNPSSYTVESADIQLMDGIWKYGSFVMWADRQGEEATAVTKIPTGSMRDVELWAIWKRDEYAVELPEQVRILSGAEQSKVQAGVDVVFEVAVSQGCRLEEVSYAVGEGDFVKLTAQNGVYRIDGEQVLGALRVLVRERVDAQITLLDKQQYRAVPEGYCVVRLTAQEPLAFGAYLLDGVPLFYCTVYSDAEQSRYVYATIAPLPQEGEDLSARIGIDTQAQAQVLSGGGDLTGDGTLQADDAKMAYLLYTGHWDTDTGFDISIRQRLEADINGDGRVDTTDVQMLMAAVWAQQKEQQHTS